MTEEKNTPNGSDSLALLNTKHDPKTMFADESWHGETFMDQTALQFSSWLRIGTVQDQANLLFPFMKTAIETGKWEGIDLSAKLPEGVDIPLGDKDSLMDSLHNAGLFSLANLIGDEYISIESRDGKLYVEPAVKFVLAVKNRIAGNFDDLQPKTAPPSVTEEGGNASPGKGGTLVGRIGSALRRTVSLGREKTA